MQEPDDKEQEEFINWTEGILVHGKSILLQTHQYSGIPPSFPSWVQKRMNPWCQLFNIASLSPFHACSRSSNPALPFPTDKIVSQSDIQNRSILVSEVLEEWNFNTGRRNNTAFLCSWRNNQDHRCHYRGLTELNHKRLTHNTMQKCKCLVMLNSFIRTRSAFLGMASSACECIYK